MISLNLISDEQKVEINKNLIYNAIRSVLYVFLVLLLIYCGVLYYLRYYIKLRTENALNEIQAINASSAIFKEKIDTINSFIDFTDLIQDGYTQYSCLIGDLTADTQGIAIDSIVIDIPGAAFRISGSAANRDDLIGYHAKLKKYEYLSPDDLPLNILSIRTNLNFEIKGSLDKKKIK